MRKLAEPVFSLSEEAVQQEVFGGTLVSHAPFAILLSWITLVFFFFFLGKKPCPNAISSRVLQKI